MAIIICFQAVGFLMVFEFCLLSLAKKADELLGRALKEWESLKRLYQHLQDKLVGGK
jgi:hypothetical protein